LRAGDVLALLGAAAAALATTALLWTQLGPFTGILGFIVVAWCLFVAYYAVLISFDENRPTMRDRVSAVVVQSLGALVVAALFFIIGYTAFQGWKAMGHLNFYTQDLGSTLSTDPLTKGGILHGIVGTLIEIGIAMGIAVPLGLLTAVFMNQVPGRFAQFTRTIVEAMTALPDILAGLFIYATFVLYFKQNSGLAAGIALAITAIPIIARAGDVVLRLVPGGLTEASYALGSTQWRTVRFVMLPTARSGLATAVILGTARALGETSPVLLTAGGTAVLNLNPTHAMMSLPLLAYNLTRSSQPGDNIRGFGAATVLLILVVLVFAIARSVGGRGPGQLTARQERRRVAASRREMARFQRRAGQVLPGAGATASRDSGGER
jgi:phosphate transport system permease protein